MKNSIQKTKKYINEYIAKDKWLRSLMVPALLALIGYNYFEIKTYQTMAKMTNADSEDFDQTLMFCTYFIISYTLVFLYELFNAYFVAISLKSSIINFFGEFLKLSYKSFSKIGLGEAQFCINRRVFSLIEFLSSICLDFVSNMFFMLIAISSMSKEIKNSRLKLTLLVLVLLFIATSCILQYLRSLVRFKVNLGFDKSSRKMYDILYNYERIVSYDNLEYELKKYRESMDDQIYYSIIFWVSFEGVQFLNSFCFVMLNIYFLSILGVSPEAQPTLKGISLVFNKVKQKVVNMVDSIDSLANNFVNLDQSVLENCTLDENENAVDITLQGKIIKIENLSFSYDQQMIFSNISTCIKPGEKIAIAGPNGTGKSTFVKILEGFYDYEGLIEIDQINTRVISKKKIREVFGYVPQSSFLFDQTLLQNLRQGNPNITNEKIIEYAKLYDFHDLFKQIGYDKRVGERGKYLSGGQRQKISFMRAIIKNSPVLLLDEATSNMDEISEEKIINKIKTQMIDKSALMIVHNLQHLKLFDKIFYFGGGTIFEEGNFNDLIERNGDFYKFYTSTLKSSS